MQVNTVKSYEILADVDRLAVAATSKVWYTRRRLS